MEGHQRQAVIQRRAIKNLELRMLNVELKLSRTL
jgi:hypothetical protein